MRFRVVRAAFWVSLFSEIVENGFLRATRKTLLWKFNWFSPGEEASG